MINPSYTLAEYVLDFSYPVHPSIHGIHSFSSVGGGGGKGVSLSTTDDDRGNVLRFIDSVNVTSVVVSLYDRPFYVSRCCNFIF